MLGRQLNRFVGTIESKRDARAHGIRRDGNERTIEGNGLLARAFQHEMDHLDGKLFVDRLRGVKRDMIVRKIQKMRRDGKW